MERIKVLNVIEYLSNRMIPCFLIIWFDNDTTIYLSLLQGVPQNCTHFIFGKFQAS